MKIIILGGGALQVKNIRLSKGMSPELFVSNIENGLEILDKLKERSNKINWADVLSKLSWADQAGSIAWFSEGT